MSTIIVIPARLESVRLPRKLLLPLGGKAIILHTIAQAKLTGMDVMVATDSDKIADLVAQTDTKVTMTDPNLGSGTDRVGAILANIPKHYQHIINLQGDIPNIDPQCIIKIAQALREYSADIITAASAFTQAEDAHKSQYVKVAMTMIEKDLAKALYFSRSPIPYNASLYYHHIGIYGYQRNALAQFIQLPPSPLELTEKLEQLRALENDMTIYVKIVDQIPVTVDTKDDFQFAQAWFSGEK